METPEPEEDKKSPLKKSAGRILNPFALKGRLSRFRKAVKRKNAIKNKAYLLKDYKTFFKASHG